MKTSITIVCKKCGDPNLVGGSAPKQLCFFCYKGIERPTDKAMKESAEGRRRVDTPFKTGEEEDKKLGS